MTTEHEGTGQEHLAAIFVHAGAGYHNLSNENSHLKACADAVQVGMSIIKSGGSAVDAVEMAVRCLENNDITNAGFGSNLTMNGIVEGDATVVDHLGRSGAVGAVTSVPNPVSAARLVYEESIKPMVLKRVPPNLLTGPGATRFVENRGLQLVLNEKLISKGSLSRYEKWKLEIDMAQHIQSNPEASANDTLRTLAPEFNDVQKAILEGPALSQNSSIASLGNESQPFLRDSASSSSPESPTPSKTQAYKTIHTSRARFDHSLGNGASQVRKVVDRNTDIRKRGFDQRDDTSDDLDSIPSDMNTGVLPATFDSIVEHSTMAIGRSQNVSLEAKSRGHRSLQTVNIDSSVREESLSTDKDDDDRIQNMNLDGAKVDECNIFHGGTKSDNITDTVGAIAVDGMGRIAAASSSGGIGMKHTGRTGPAALVGVGTAVIPLDPEDENQTTVACVTSGTGEHMATSIAAHTCASRLYTNTKLAKAGSLVETSEDDAMQSFVKRDFMGHPGVKASHSGGAIGAMLVKKSRDGMWLYWVHNTDSFALASMHIDDEVPYTTMSRNKRAGMIATGARVMRRADHNEKTGDKSRQGYASKRRKNHKQSKVRQESARSPQYAQSSRMFTKTTEFRKRSSTGVQAYDGAFKDPTPLHATVVDSKLHKGV